MTTLPAIFDASSVGPFFDQIRTLDFDNDVTLDASNVAKISTLAVQTLLSLDKTLQQHGKALHIKGATAEFNEVVDELGLSEILAKWSA